MKYLISFLIFLFPQVTYSQQTIHTQDIDNFWIAYDSIRSTTDKEQQINFINRFYIDKASDGLKAFLNNKSNPANKWLDLINSDRDFWDSIRPKTLLIKTLTDNLQISINGLRELYPDLKKAATYFIIGFRQQGGTVRDNLSIIGSEVVMSFSGMDSAELARIVVHEYVHTQQSKPDFRNINVLTSSIREGACDFISELVLRKDLTLPYIKYGLKNEVAVWKVFVHDMLSTANDFWVSTGNNPLLPEKDLGYYVGYIICRFYYNNALNKSQAIKHIIDLDFTNQIAVNEFLKKSNYEEYIVSKGYNPENKMNAEGCVLTPTKVIFSFSPFNKTIIKDENGQYKILEQKDTIRSVSIAGDFNNWDYKNSMFQLEKRKNGDYILKIDRSKLGGAGKQVKFKFVIDNKYWVEPKFAISNRLTDRQGSYLFFRL